MKLTRLTQDNPQSGFTLLEMLVVIVLLGILATLAAPGWLAFLSRQQLNNAQNTIYQSMKDAQSKAQQRSEPWQFSIRDTGDALEIATHRASSPPSFWSSISDSSSLNIDDTGAKLAVDADGVYSISFDHQGNVEDSIGSVVLLSERTGQLKRTVEVTTLIGTIRKSSD